MEGAYVGVRTRARAMAMSTVTEEMVEGLGAVAKRRKVSNKKLRSTFLQIKTHDKCEIKVIDNLVIEDELVDSSNVCTSVRSGSAQVACCSSTGSTEKPKALDLEVESVETETKTETEIDARYNIERSKLSTPTSDYKEESYELESSETKQLPESNKSCPKMPPETELEEFFAAAQEDLNKRFKHKYNYDIVNDTPLKGRFEWIKLKPEQ